MLVLIQKLEDLITFNLQKKRQSYEFSKGISKHDQNVTM